MLLDISLINFGGRGQSCTQRVTGKQREAVFFGEVRADAAFEDTVFDKPRNMFVAQAGLKGALSVARGAYKDGTKVDLCEVPPVFQRMHRAGLVA